MAVLLPMAHGPCRRASASHASELPRLGENCNTSWHPCAAICRDGSSPAQNASAITIEVPSA
ncbi:hypothetical protein VD0002_g6490 [Verticillium dahliae]|nr:hypothetical protein VD0004_g8163 [Verticillium dahliae]PNH49394.1 hypothetical protein VD0003_g7755 [Verticillium dahliae]PNH61302.1 hypothetical protein VD0002_g6490 [Verticillium dahliae]